MSAFQDGPDSGQRLWPDLDLQGSTQPSEFSCASQCGQASLGSSGHEQVCQAVVGYQWKFEESCAQQETLKMDLFCWSNILFDCISPSARTSATFSSLVIP